MSNEGVPPFSFCNGDGERFYLILQLPGPVGFLLLPKELQSSLKFRGAYLFPLKEPEEF